MLIYLVRGQTGAYSDRYDWTVKAFYHKDEADKLASDAEAWVLKRIEAVNEFGEVDVDNCPYDKSCTCYGVYDGISYWVEEVELSGNDD